MHSNYFLRTVTTLLSCCSLEQLFVPVNLGDQCGPHVDQDGSQLLSVSAFFAVQRASFFAASDENHRPLSAASNSDQLEDQALVQMKSYSRWVTQR